MLEGLTLFFEDVLSLAKAINDSEGTIKDDMYQQVTSVVNYICEVSTEESADKIRKEFGYED